MSSPVSPGQAVVYGIVQGLTEFLPISSSGHLRIVPAVFGWKDPGSAFTAVIQLGTMVAVVLFFWRELLHISVAWLRGLVEKTILEFGGLLPRGLFERLETGLTWDGRGWRRRRSPRSRSAAVRPGS